MYTYVIYVHTACKYIHIYTHLLTYIGMYIFIGKHRCTFTRIMFVHMQIQIVCPMHTHSHTLHIHGPTC